MIFQPPSILQSLFPSLIWRIPNAGNKIFLTFDDGPDPEATPRILDLLAEHNAKATFFCLGRQVEKYPVIFDRIKTEGHAVGNHTFSHLSGWTTDTKKYFADIERADQLIDSILFRPPYGRIRPSQIWVLKEKYKIVMWDVMSGDYDERQTPEMIFARVKKKIQPGSVVVMHDKNWINSWEKDLIGSFLENSVQKEFNFGLFKTQSNRDL